MFQIFKSENLPKYIAAATWQFFFNRFGDKNKITYVGSFYGFFKLMCYVLGLLCDLLWSDPDKDVQGWGENDRGVSFTFGADVVSKFLNRHDLDLICRAHQVT